MSNKNFQNEENEILSRDDARVRDLLGSLERVDAPKDFDFKLKARIANGAPKDVQPRVFPILRYAAPLGLAVIILAVIVFNGLYSFDRNSVPTIASNSAANPVENLSLPDNSQPQFVAASNTEDLKNPAAETFDVNKFSGNSKNELTENLRKPKSASQDEKNGGGSTLKAGTQPKIFLPPGISSNKTIEAPKDLTSALSVKDVLSLIGVEGNFSDNKWKVEAVRQNSQAERSGVKVNDVIEAIDEKDLSTGTISTDSKGTFSGKKLTVVRGGERLEIKLQNK